MLTHPVRDKKKRKVTSPFGSRVHPVTGKRTQHNGIDIGCGAGAKIQAAAYGRIKTIAKNSARGWYVVLTHADGLETWYQHLKKKPRNKQVGQIVTAGQWIATSGATGQATGPHLHFEVHVDGAPVNPSKYL